VVVAEMLVAVAALAVIEQVRLLLTYQQITPVQLVLAVMVAQVGFLLKLMVQLAAIVFSQQ
jgi:hypothetical protein